MIIGSHGDYYSNNNMHFIAVSKPINLNLKSWEIPENLLKAAFRAKTVLKTK